ncbi:hypothetical protein M752DRAFT_267623 [Aspergillus phoenicis ATCC 13157]|uniref:Uncharacterized protein n=2 Tax=Aspergillus TaxID=5052 RepID=A0A370PEE2_ASPPH|nr:hypothetical protein M747DRAFT_300936 [Aspergillus niger ATCC 13496]RDK40546.1 hypothetical protein M752DRAFT_267623 [Aspergillus phoenicis ATCC 13157]
MQPQAEGKGQHERERESPSTSTTPQPPAHPNPDTTPTSTTGRRPTPFPSHLPRPIVPHPAASSRGGRRRTLPPPQPQQLAPPLQHHRRSSPFPSRLPQRTLTSTTTAQTTPPRTRLESIYGAQSYAFWLGRLMTVLNAILYADLFDAPDPVTGIRPPSVFSLTVSRHGYSQRVAALAGSDRGATGRFRRAFMMLEDALYMMRGDLAVLVLGTDR